MTELIILKFKIADWQRKTFGLANTIKGKMEHIKLEAQEVIDNPKDISEYADILILLLGSLDLAGYTITDLLNAADSKLIKCQTRQWSAPDENGVCHHIN